MESVTLRAASSFGSVSINSGLDLKPISVKGYFRNDIFRRAFITDTEIAWRVQYSNGF